MENNSSCIAQKWRSNDLLTQTRNAPIYTPWVAKGIVKIKKIPVRIYHESSPKPYGPRGLQYNFFIAHSKMNMPFVYTIFTSLFFLFLFWQWVPNKERGYCTGGLFGCDDIKFKFDKKSQKQKDPFQFSISLSTSFVRLFLCIWSKIKESRPLYLTMKSS